MTFKSLNKDELTEVAEFFAVDVEAANEENGPSKNEIVSALAEGDDPVTWEQYKTIYLKAKEAGTDKSSEAEELPDLTDIPQKEEVEEEEDDTPKVVIKMERKNPRFDIRGLTFTTNHPFHSVDEKTAEYLIKEVDGFRLAMSSEVAEYYN